MFTYTVMFGSDPKQKFNSIDSAFNDALCMIKLENFKDNVTIRIYNCDDDLVMRAVICCGNLSD